MQGASQSAIQPPICGRGHAARHPERVDRLILYGTYARGRLRWTDLPNEVEKGRVLLDLTQLGWGQENHAFLQVWASQFQPGGTLEHLRSWCTQQCAATSAETAVRLLRIGWNVDVRDAARKIKCPVLIVHPERDAVVPIDQGRLLASLIPDSRFVQLDSENHMLLSDEPAWPRLVDEVRQVSRRTSISLCRHREALARGRASKDDGHGSPRGLVGTSVPGSCAIKSSPSGLSPQYIGCRRRHIFARGMRPACHAKRRRCAIRGHSSRSALAGRGW